MTRAALLISNPGEVGAENYCKGVFTDVENFRALLTSAEGGAWNDAEIIALNRPSVAKLRLNLLLHSYKDYVFIMFTGHGWYSDPDKDCILELRKGEEIASLELRKNTKRRTVILDCCQKVYPVSLQKESRAEFSAKDASAARTANKANCRAIFDKALQSADPGIVVMNSCTVGQLSHDRGEDKGANYAGSLLDCAAEWSKDQARKGFFAPNAELSCITVHNCASVSTLLLSGGTQSPTIEKPKTSPYFPFCVFG